jgi:hypothetical protein
MKKPVNAFQEIGAHYFLPYFCSVNQRQRDLNLTATPTRLGTAERILFLDKKNNINNLKYTQLWKQ